VEPVVDTVAEIDPALIEGKLTVKIGCWPELATERLERLTTPFDGIATFVQPEIAPPPAVVTVSVPDVAP
jgi:hypothetical protein